MMGFSLDKASVWWGHNYYCFDSMTKIGHNSQIKGNRQETLFYYNRKSIKPNIGHVVADAATKTT